MVASLQDWIPDYICEEQDTFDEDESSAECEGAAAFFAALEEFVVHDTIGDEFGLSLIHI